MTLYGSPCQAAQALILDMLEAMGKEPDRSFTIALSGGSTPAVLFELWEREYAAYTPWGRLYFYWVDERCVSPNDDRSNFGLTNRLFLSKVGLPGTHFFRIIGEGTPKEEARQYSALVKATVPTVHGVPLFDFVLLGIGEDGHTSSIFPGDETLLTASEPYVVSIHPRDKSVRICLTGEPMIKAQHTCFLVTGANKENIVGQVLNKANEQLYPAAYVWHRAQHARMYASF